MDLRSSIACVVGICLGVAIFYGAAGGAGRLTAAPTATQTLAPRPAAPAFPRTAGDLEAESPRSAAPSEPEPAGAAAPAPEAKPTPAALDPARRSRIHHAFAASVEDAPGERVVLLRVEGAEPELPALEAGGLVLVERGDADENALGATLAAIRDASPGVRVARVGFLPVRRGEPTILERSAATLASVDLLAVAPPANASAAAAERFYDKAGRHGRRVLALIAVPRTPAELASWQAAFEGATAAGVGVVLMGEPGGDPATEAAWRADVAAHEALQRRLGGIAYD